MDGNTDVWRFPQEIEFWLVPEYLKKMEGSTFKDIIVFDLSETDNVHSSFIGFLIFVKQSTEKQGGKLVLKVSSALKRLFVMLNILEYFATSLTDQKIRKIA